MRIKGINKERGEVMKPLNQLGISPAPWSVDNHNNIRTDDGHTLAATVVSNAYGLDRTENNALIIAAAPELYAALFEMVEMYQNCGSYDYEQEVIKTAKAALAKAAGESEVKE